MSLVSMLGMGQGNVTARLRHDFSVNDLTDFADRYITVQVAIGDLVAWKDNMAPAAYMDQAPLVGVIVGGDFESIDVRGKADEWKCTVMLSGHGGLPFTMELPVLRLRPCDVTEAKRMLADYAEKMQVREQKSIERLLAVEILPAEVKEKHLKGYRIGELIIFTRTGSEYPAILTGLDSMKDPSLSYIDLSDDQLETAEPTWPSIRKMTAEDIVRYGGNPDVLMSDINPTTTASSVN